MQATKKLLDVTRDRRKKLKKEKEKRKMGKYQRPKNFFNSHFFMQKNLYFVKTQIWKNFVIIIYIATLFLLQFFYQKRSFRYQRRMGIWVCIGSIDAVLDPKIQVF